MKTIFIQIASYRDPELVGTGSSAISKAKHPDRLHFGIFDQFLNGDQLLPLPKQCKCVRHGLVSAISLGKARSFANRLYDGEDYYLQIDSHTQFDQDWDIRLIDQIESSRTRFSNPVLSSYPGMYRVDERGKSIYSDMASCKTVVTGWHDSASPIFEPRVVQLVSPRLARALAGGFIFADGHFAEVPQDQDITFLGEEVLLSIQAFTRGYTMLHPADVPLWHHYERKNSHKQWVDFPEQWQELNKRSVKKVESAVSGSLNSYFGQHRSLADYEVFSGLDFKTHSISTNAMHGVEPKYTGE